MVKHPKKGRGRNFVAIPFEAEKALTTLADDTVIIQSLLSAAFTEDFFAISVDVLWQIRNLTVGEGPLPVGLAHGDYTVGEILEAIEAERLGPDDMILNEKANRKVRRSGSFSGVTGDSVLNDGKPIRTPLRFSVGSGHTLSAWLVSRAAVTNLTTGATLILSGTLYGRWQR